MISRPEKWGCTKNCEFGFIQNDFIVIFQIWPWMSLDIIYKCIFRKKRSVEDFVCVSFENLLLYTFYFWSQKLWPLFLTNNFFQGKSEGCRYYQKTCMVYNYKESSYIINVLRLRPQFPQYSSDLRFFARFRIPVQFGRKYSQKN